MSEDYDVLAVFHKKNGKDELYKGIKISNNEWEFEFWEGKEDE